MLQILIKKVHLKLSQDGIKKKMCINVKLKFVVDYP